RVRYTPFGGFEGTDEFEYELMDSLGNTSRATVTVFVGDAFAEDLVRYNVQFFDVSGTTPISTINVGQEFIVRVTVEDVRDDVPDASKGVFQAFLDLLYDTSRVTLVSPLSFNGPYTQEAEGDTSTPGIIDEAGAFRPIQFFANLPGEQTVFQARFRAEAPGAAAFITDPADEVFDPGPPPVVGDHDTLIYVPASVVEIDDITYLTQTITIGGSTGGSGEGTNALHNY